MVYVLYNSYAGAHYGEEKIAERLSIAFPGESFTYADAMKVGDKQAFVSNLDESDKLVIVGGDGTIHHFVNSIEDKEYPFDIYCFAAGSGNDFIFDIMGKKTDEIIRINDYIRNLPVVTVNGNSYRFVNGIGYGIDGDICAIGNAQRDKSGGKKHPNYTAIAVKCLLFGFDTVKAEVYLDGVKQEFSNVWMVPTMNGRCYGGGMMIAPSQDRLNPERLVSTAVVVSKSRFKLLSVFPKVFTGEHVKYTDLFKIFTAKEVQVKFSRPVAINVDGETFLDVTEYSVKSAALLENNEERELQSV